MTRADLETALSWAADEGWNPGYDDAEAFQAADPEGFFIAVDDGAPVAAISVVNHSAEFAFLGLYLCQPTHRGRGIGYALWQHALIHAGKRTVGLDGVPDQQENYARSGFVLAGETVRYAGTVTSETSPFIRPASANETDQLVQLETAASGWAKPVYLSHWFAQTGHRKTLVLVEDGGIQGMTTVRRCREGSKIGPLIARSRGAAHALIQQASDEMGGPVVLDVPSTSRGLDSLCCDLGLSPGFRTARMYRGETRTSTHDFYAVTTLELG